MNHSKIFFCLAVILLVLGLAGCGSEPVPTLEPTATEYTYPPPMNDPDEFAASILATPEEEVAAAPTEAPEAEPTEEVASEPQVDNCVECHNDQQMLIDTADPVAEVVSENEGEG